MGDLEEEIFGADSDEDVFESKARETKNTSLESAIFGDEDDDLFQDSDDDRPSGGGKSKKLGTKKKFAENRLVDSDDEGAAKRKEGKLKKSKKRKREEKRSGKEKKIPKTDAKGDKDKTESSDEYDSGEEVKETQDDRDFIDEDDDLDDVRREYEEDVQNFDDERPLTALTKKKSSASKSSASSSSYVPKTKELDPLSQTLNEIRKPKPKAFSDAEKDMMVEKLLKKMGQAVELDDECFQQKQPAVNKLKLLPAVQRAVAMKDLHNTLLDKDFLCYLRDWIEPKNASTLPALSLRTAVYEMLLKLPCLTEHLKRGNDKMPIGFVIVSLRKHKMETPENKRLLKEIMDRWSRPIFSKTEGSADGVSFAHADNEEVKVALARKYSDPSGQAINSASLAGNEYGNLKSVMGGGGSTKKEPDLHNRARAPTSHGYLFTVQPELKKY